MTTKKRSQKELLKESIKLLQRILDEKLYTDEEKEEWFKLLDIVKAITDNYLNQEILKDLNPQ